MGFQGSGPGGVLGLRALRLFALTFRAAGRLRSVGLRSGGYSGLGHHDAHDTDDNGAADDKKPCDDSSGMQIPLEPETHVLRLKTLKL